MFFVCSFHWSIAIICNPGSAIIKKHHKVKRCHRGIKEAPSLGQERSLVDLVNGGGEINVGRESSGVGSTDYSIVSSEFVEEELQSCQADRLAYPPCLLFLDSLRCHRKKKFTKMLRNYLECEYKTRFASSSNDAISQRGSMVGADIDNEQDTVITVFDSDSIVLHEPDVSYIILKDLMLMIAYLFAPITRVRSRCRRTARTAEFFFLCTLS